jgi:NAD(P)-dependent dehydrogenase (short-subunit alcohol dehydrogenase family)
LQLHFAFNSSFRTVPQLMAPSWFSSFPFIQNGWAYISSSLLSVVPSAWRPQCGYACWYLVFWALGVGLSLVLVRILFLLLSPRKPVVGKVFLITGGANGIGRGMAQRLHQMGATVVVWDIDALALKAMDRETQGKIHTYLVNVTNRKEVYEVARQVLKDVGRVDVLINNAGVVAGKSVLEIPDEQIERTIQVNLLANFWTIKAFLPQMQANNSGHIVTISSVLGTFSGYGLTDYSASKFGSFGFTEALRMELKSQKTNIRTTLVCPYHINTGMFDGVSLPYLVRLVFPPLDANYVVKRIITAIQREEEMIVIGPFFWLVFFLRFILPVWAFDQMAKILGAWDGMKTFTGKQKNQLSPEKKNK